MMTFGTYQIANFDFDEVEEWTARLTAEVVNSGEVFRYTFPKNSKEIDDVHQWNLENANGWGGSSPDVNVSNMYVNSQSLQGNKAYSITFPDPQSRFFTSFTAYDK